MVKLDARHTPYFLIHSICFSRELLTLLQVPQEHFASDRCTPSRRKYLLNHHHLHLQIMGIFKRS